MQQEPVDTLEARRQELLEMIDYLNREHRKHLKPYIDALVQIEACTIRPVYLMTDEVFPMGRHD